MEPQRSFVTLACPACQGEKFVPLIALKHKPGGGLVPDQAGYACLQCQAPVDPQAALNAYSIRQKREELKTLEAELGITHA